MHMHAIIVVRCCLSQRCHCFDHVAFLLVLVLMLSLSTTTTVVIVNLTAFSFAMYVLIVGLAHTLRLLFFFFNSFSFSIFLSVVVEAATQFFHRFALQIVIVIQKPRLLFALFVRFFFFFVLFFILSIQFIFQCFVVAFTFGRCVLLLFFLFIFYRSLFFHLYTGQ